VTPSRPEGWPVPDPVHLPDEIVDRAAQGHASLAPTLAALRAIPAELLDGIEPDEATRWVQR